MQTRTNKTSNFLLTSITSLISLVGLSACASNTTNNPTHTMNIQPAYNSQTLYFHYFSLEVPNEIDLDESIMETSFSGNRFHAYPIESQQAFDDLVESRIAIFKNHKISQEALDYEKESYEILDKLNLQERKKDHPPLNMTTALYKAIKYDDQHYQIIANPLTNLDSTYNSAMYGQWYIYFPKQDKYVMTKQARFPASTLVTEDVEKYGRAFINTKISPINQRSLSNPKAMAVGPVTYNTPIRHPVIEYILESSQVPMRIELESRGYSGDKYDQIRALQKGRAKQLKSSNEGKARHLGSGSRTVANMQGREVCYYFPRTEYKEPKIWCSWGTDGKPDNLDYPFIQVGMFYNVDDSESSRNTAMQAWEQLLGSFKRRGHS